MNRGAVNGYTIPGIAIILDEDFTIPVLTDHRGQVEPVIEALNDADICREEIYDK